MGIHMPPGGSAADRRKRHRRSRRQRSPKVPVSELNKQLAETDAGNDKRGMAPSQRVQFLLQQQDGAGGDDDDNSESIETHKVFTEMEELVGSGDKQEWRETARSVDQFFKCFYLKQLASIFLLLLKHAFMLPVKQVPYIHSKFT